MAGDVPFENSSLIPHSPLSHYSGLQLLMNLSGAAKRFHRGVENAYFWKSYRFHGCLRTTVSSKLQYQNANARLRSTGSPHAFPLGLARSLCPAFPGRRGRKERQCIVSPAPLSQQRDKERLERLLCYRKQSSLLTMPLFNLEPNMTHQTRSDSTQTFSPRTPSHCSS